MLKNGYKQSQVNHTLFIKHSHQRVTILIVYVDDIVVTGNDYDEMGKLKRKLAVEFEIKDLGRLKYFIGIELSTITGYLEIGHAQLQIGALLLVIVPLWVALVTWRSKKQPVVARSSAEVEFRAMTHGVCELLCIRLLISEIGLPVQGPVSLYCDKAAISIAHNFVEHDCTKHIEIIDYDIIIGVFGNNGVLTRYLLEKLFGPGVVGVTSDLSILYIDLPSNMVGSFLMGWFGVVFKGDISCVSDLLAIGLTTGYLGSLTTFSGWNQKMLELSVKGHWVLSVLGFLIGMFLVAYSIIFGIETANGFRWLLKRFRPSWTSSMSSSSSNWRVDSYKRHLAVMVVLVLMLGLLWGISGALVKSQFDSDSSNAQLWLACMVGPPGVWVRWFLSRLNGKGLGRKRLMKWVPFGTLLANVGAACIMAALATVKKVVDTERCETIATGIQFGLLGCLSTVSTFIAEFHAMRESKHPWRAYLYALITIIPSFGLGTLIYSVPVWKVR
ncbi:hypothetical protein HHK36_004549 [Tetracentron sinense]|uniref:Reverse transcriptase Ty1/copia-type domain-containing protein n=1 Tax=Tetracentron sinense TaxID=13715 RepID=A0A834ZUM2_TETSI|nr:hypothetical protein HHK36_004549 [Tetracentron sinense]